MRPSPARLLRPIAALFDREARELVLGRVGDSMVDGPVDDGSGLAVAVARRCRPDCATCR